MEKTSINFITNFINGIKPKNYHLFSKLKKGYFWCIFILLSLAIFITVITQIPQFVSIKLNSFFNAIWIVVLFILLLFDYKVFLHNLLTIILVFLPFIIYCLLSLIWNYNHFFSDMTRNFYVSYLVFLCGACYSNYANTLQKKYFSLLYIFASIILGIVVYLTYLKDYNLADQVYAYVSKNSTGPILLNSSILSIFVFSKKNRINIVVQILLFLYFVVLIAIMKCRAALLASIIISLSYYYYRIKHKKMICIISTIALLFLFSILFLIPFLRQNILINIILNGKSDLDSILSGRISIIADFLAKSNPAIGNGSCYVDCLPINLYCNYGIIGTLTTVFIVMMPFYFLFNIERYDKIKITLIFLAISLIINSLFEAYGFFGPGTKTFIFWLLVSIEKKSVAEKEYYINSLIKKAHLLFNRITPCHITGLIQYALLGFCSIVLIPSINSYCFISLKSIVPEKSVSVEYIKPESIMIDGPSIMCVGQSFNYKSTVYPENVTDNGVGWSYWGNNKELEVDYASGLVKALQTGGYNIVANSLKINDVYATKLVQIVDPANYNFNDLKLFGSDNKEISSINIRINETLMVHYDRNYVPDTINVNFETNDSSVAFIDENGVIRGCAPGVAEIIATIKNDSGTFKSNKIIVNVLEEAIETTSYFDIISDSTGYQHVPIKINAVFDEKAVDKNIIIETNNSGVKIINDELIFNSFGQQSISFISQNNYSLKKTVVFNILENNIEKMFFENNDWVHVGDLFKINLMCKFENGYIKEATNEEIIIKKENYSIRAWNEKNGIVDDYFTYKAIKTGDASVSYRSSLNPSITSTLKFKISNETKNHFNSKAITIYGTCILLLSLIGFLLANCETIKKPWKYIIKNAPSIITIPFAIIFLNMIHFFDTTSYLFVFNLVFVVLLFLSDTLLIINSVARKKSVNIFAEHIEYIHVARFKELNI